jgi:hypothetical protein
MKRFALGVVLSLASLSAFAQWSVDVHPLSTFFGLSTGLLVKGGIEYEVSQQIVITARPALGLITMGRMYGGELGGEYHFGTAHDGLYAGGGLGLYVATVDFDSVYLDSITVSRLMVYLEVGYGWVFDRIKLGAAGMLQQVLGGSPGLGVDAYVGWRL